MRILANGYVGINTNSPTNQLTVNGSASFGNLTNQINNVSSIAVGSNDTITSLGSIAVGDKVTATANACAIFGKREAQTVMAAWFRAGILMPRATIV